MINFFTLAYSNSVKNRNGYALQTASLTDLAKYSINKSKIDQPVCYVYSGIKGTYKSTNIFFIDIDKEIEEVFNDPSKLFNRVPCIKAIQKSFSGKLHIFIEYGDKIDDEDSYNETSLILHAFVNEAINLCYGIDLYKLGIEDNKEYLDTHNAKWSQGLFISSYEPVYNLNWYLTKIDEQTIKFLKEKYDFLSSKTSSKTLPKHSNETSIAEYKGERVKVDRGFTIAGYKGNDARWRISNVFLFVFGDVQIAKKECDKRFYYEDGKSIFSVPRSNRTPNKKVMGDLIKLGYIDLTVIESSKCDLFLKQGEYLSDKKDILLNMIRDLKRVSIQSPVGTGKTTFVKNDLVNELNNPIIVVPYNATNSLYDGICLVSSSNNNKVPKNAPARMVIDQAVINWDEVKNHDLIIDEGHIIFEDRTYRKSVVEFFNKLKDFNNKIVSISATPSGEVESLGLKVITVGKEMKKVPTKMVVTNNTTKYINKLINSEKILNYDHVVFCADICHNFIRDNLVTKFGEENVADIRRSKENTEDYKNLIETETLTKRFYVNTKVAYQGLNFKNEGEKILIVTIADVNNTTYRTIEQQVGRVRKSDVCMEIIFDENQKTITKETMESSIRKAKKTEDYASREEIDTRMIPYNEDLLEDDTNNAKCEIIEFNENQVGYANVYRDLLANPRYELYEVTENFDKGREENSFKRNASNKFREEFIKDSSIAFKVYEQGSYEEDWSSAIRKILRNYEISEELLQNLVNEYSKSAMMNAILSSLEWDFYVCTKDEEYLKREEKTIMESLKSTQDLEMRDVFKVSLSLFKKAWKVRKEIGKIRMKSCMDIDIEDPSGDIFMDIFKVYQEENKKRFDKKSNNSKESGKKGKKAIKDPKTGIIYESREAAAKALGVSATRVTKMIQKNQLIRV